LDNHKKLRVVLVAITLVLVLIYVIRQDIASVFVNDVRTNYWGYEFRESNLTKSIQMLEFDDDFEKIEVQKVIGVDASTANTIMMNNIAVFRSLFEKQRVGYRGQHTEYIECPDEFKPKYSSRTIENGTLHYFLGFANNRFTMVACTEEDIVHSAISAFLYCANVKTMFEINYFGPRHDSQRTTSFINKVRCHP
jgi:hypothetical protein